MKYTITYQKNEVLQAIAVEAATADQATAYFKQYKPAAVFVGICEGMENKPGLPLLTVPKDWEPEAVTVDRIRESIEAEPQRSAWDKGVTVYALELLDELEEAITGGYFAGEDLEAPALLRRQLLNGANDWNAYSWGGCSLVYNSDIAERLCTPSELKRTRNGERRPNSAEKWLDTQARALHQAANRICRHARNNRKEG